ncbi:hypothetical protein BH18THE2_BH18THE2_26530 [soil metagenome]
MKGGRMINEKDYGLGPQPRKTSHQTQASKHQPTKKAGGIYKCIMVTT